MKIGLFVDTGNLYHRVKATYNKKVDYSAMMAYVTDLGSVEIANAYGVDMGSGTANFRTKLQEIGYCCTFQPIHGNPNVTMTLDIMSYIDKIDCLVLGTSDSALLPVIQRAMAAGINVIIVGSNISSLLQDATCIEIPPSFLME